MQVLAVSQVVQKAWNVPPSYRMTGQLQQERAKWQKMEGRDRERNNKRYLYASGKASKH